MQAEAICMMGNRGHLRRWLGLSLAVVVIAGGVHCETQAVTPSSDGGVAQSDATSDAFGGNADAPTGPLEATHFIGRFDTTVPARPKMSWSSSALVTRFSGTGMTLKLRDEGSNFFQVVLVGESSAPTNFSTVPGVTDYVIASRLPPGEHTIAVYKRTEIGPVTFLGFSPENGAIIPSVYPVARRIELIGDSISCGYGVDGVGPDCKFTLQTENAYVSYGAIAARALGAELSTIAWSGRGVFRNANPDEPELLPDLYKRTIANDPASVWNHSFSPDALVVNLGTNDFSAGDPGEEFKTAYVAFLKQLRDKNATSQIIVALGPMLLETKLEQARGYLQAVVKERNDDGDALVSFLEFPSHTAADGYGCDYHPSLKSHQKMSALLADALRAKLKW
jgi:lysophospholipase L1-like esterase